MKKNPSNTRITKTPKPEQGLKSEYITFETLEELKNHYIKKLGEQRKKNKDFLELPFLQQEREKVIAIWKKEKSPTKKAMLFRLLASFLNFRLPDAEMKYKNHPSNIEEASKLEAEKHFNKAIKYYELRLEKITTPELKRMVNRDLMSKCEKSISDLLTKGDLNRFDMRAHLIAEQKYYEYLKSKEKEIHATEENSLLQNSPPQKIDTIAEQDQRNENDFILSTIEDWLHEFKELMTDTDYQKLVSSLAQYLENGSFPKLTKPIQINGRPNKKWFGWALNRIFEAKGKGIDKELLRFAKQNISLFTKVKFDEDNIQKSNLYKYFTTKTK